MFPGLLRRLFEKDGAGPLLQPNLFRQTNYTTTLTTSGNWTAPYDGYYFVEVQGGGGGGGSCRKTSTTAIGSAICGGGQAGEFIEGVKWYAKGTILNYTIGAGGGYDRGGGNTVFDGIVAHGGSPGVGLDDPPTGNVYFLYSQYNVYSGIPGDPGNIDRYNYTGGPHGGRSGKGGGTIFGTGGGQAYATISSTAAANGAAGKNGVGYGSGGSGGAGHQTTAYGGAGAPGCVRITFIGV